MQKGSIRRNHSVIYTWISSYVLILVLFIVSGFVMERLATKKMIEEYKEITGTLQEQANESLQTYFDKMKNQAIEICSDSTIVNYALSAQPEGANYYNLIRIQERLNNQMLTAQDEIMLYLYFENIGKAVTPGTVYDSAAFYRELNRYFELDDAGYEGLLSRKYLFTVLALDAEQGDGKTVAMLTSIPSTGTGVKGVFVQVLDQQVLRGILESRTVLADSTTVLIDESGQVLCSSGNTEIVGAIDFSGIPVGAPSEISIDGEAYWISGESMNVENWKLVTLLPMSSIVAKTAWVPRTMIPVLCVVLLIGIVVSASGVCVNYLPLRKLSRTVPSGSQAVKLKNEFEMLNFAFQDMHTELASMQLLQNAQAEQLRLEFLRFCLENSIDLDESSLIRIIENLGVRIHNGQFLAAIFDVSTGDDGQMLPIADIVDIVTQLFSGPEFAEYGSCYVLVRNDLPVMLFYLEHEEDEKALRGLCKEKLTLLSEQFCWDLVYAFSSLHRGFSEIHLAYLEACELLDYKYYRFGRAAEGAEEEPKLPEYGQIRYSAVQEELLMRYVIAGNKEDALDLLRMIYDNNFQEEGISLPVACYLMEDIAIGMMKALSAERCLDDGALEQINRTLEGLRRASSREALRNLVNTLAAELADRCMEQKQRERSVKNLPVERIMNCVEEHFRECDFNVSRAAEYLDMNMTYLSRYFKEHTGIGLLNYINGVRIDYAKQLMREQNITVAEAARAAGFENQNTFIRLFKKFEGKTPGLFLGKE